MANTILIRRGSGTPTYSDFTQYELAYDYTNDKLYIRDGNAMVEIGGSSGISMSGSTNNGVLTRNTDSTATVEPGLTFSGSTLDLPNAGDWSNILNNTNSGGLRFGTKDSGGTLAYQIELSNTGNYVKLNENTIVTGNITVSGTVDGRDVASDGSKLDGIASGATANAGTVTSVATGTGLTGGTITGSGTISLTNHSGDLITSGTVAAARIANLAASKITSGTFADARIPSLAASKITSGEFATARVNWDSTDKTVRWNNGRGYHGNPRSVAMGYSGSNYGQLGYNIEFTTTSGQHTYSFNDIATRVDLYDGIVVYTSVSGGTAGSTISWTELLECRNNTFTFKGSQIPTMANGSNNRVMTSNDAFSINGEANLTFDGTTLQVNNRIHMDGTSPFIRIQESGVTNDPEWWVGGDGGNFSIRLNNSGSYPMSIVTDSDNDAVDHVSFGYNVSIPQGSRYAWGNSHTYISEDADDRLRFFVGGAEFMRFTESSSDSILLYHNTGIGTTTPDTRLDVAANGVNGIVINQDGNNADISSRLFFKEQNSTITLYNTGDTFSFRTGATINSTSGTERFQINSSGNVLCGNATSPSIEIRNTASGAGSGPSLIFGHSQSGTTQVARIESHLLDGSESNRAGNLEFWTSRAGTPELGMQLQNDKKLRIFQPGDTTDFVEFYVDNDRANYHCGHGGGHKFFTDHGNIEFGPMNTGGAHVYTDRSQFFFNKRMTIGVTPGEAIVQSYGDYDIQIRRAQSTNDRIVIEADQHSHYVNGTKRLETKADGILVNGISKASSYLQIESSGTTVRRYVSSWGNATTHDVIHNGYGTNLGDYVYLKASGNTTNNHGIIVVADSYIFMGRDNLTTGALDNSATAPISDVYCRIDTSGNALFDGDVVAYSTTIASDERLKENVKDLNYGLKDVLNIRPVSFDWKDKRNGQHDIGVIAQEIEKIIPEVVVEVDTLNSEDTHKTVDYAKLTSVLIKAVQEQQQQINELKEKLNV
jgi:hypothetical protein